MSNRWRVHRGRHPLGGLHPDGQWGVIKPGEIDFHHLFPTHAEAMAYAEEKAREVTVILPHVDGQTAVHGASITTTTTGQVIHGYARLGYRLQEVFIPHDRAEQVALALLAHVRKGEA